MTDAPAGQDPPAQEQAAQAPAPARKNAFDSAGDYSKYEVTSAEEIMTILRGLRDDLAMITCHFNRGYDFLLTSLIDISADGKSMFLDYGSSPEMNRKLLQADKIICTSSKDKVKIQFRLDGVDGLKYEGRDAFVGAVPSSLVRLQRREYFRLQTPKASPLTCTIPVQQADGALRVAQAVVLDISGGGVALTMAVGESVFKADAEFFEASIKLPDIGVLNFAFRIRNVHDLTMPNGRAVQRAVCQFINLPAPMTTLIQRYINQVQRQRQLREA